jgi:hypothetical protein
MKKFHPHIYFWLTALSIFIISEISILNISTDIVINTKDTYYVISRKVIGYLFASLYFLMGCVYWLCSNQKINLNTNLTRFHTISCLVTVVVYYSFLIYYKYFIIITLLEPSNDTFINLILVFTTLILQVHFIYNIVTSLIAHYKNK